MYYYASYNDLNENVYKELSLRNKKKNDYSEQIFHIEEIQYLIQYASLSYII